MSEAALPPGGTSLLPADLQAAFRLGGSPNVATLQTVEVQGQPFRQAFRVRTVQRPEQVYHVSLRATTAAPVNRGDVILLSCAMRAVETSTEAGEAHALCVFEKAGEPYTKSLTVQVGVGRDWKRVYLPFQAGASYPAGGAQLCFQVGFTPQVIDIADIRLINYGTSVSIASLPRLRVEYPGRAEDAPWRREALQRIEKIRKGDLRVTVVDAAGRPVRGAEVSVRMTRHAYAFGSAVAADALLAQNPDSEKYRDHVKRLFNRVVMENDLKWPPWEGNRQRAINGVQWLVDQGIEVRGHCMVWPSWRNTPRDLITLKDQPEKLRQRVADHIRDIATTMRGKLVEWDVINEPFSNKDLMAILGDDIMVEWFKLAHEADPNARLFLNDYPILGSGSAHFDHFKKTIRFLLEKGAPLQGIGVQCHYGRGPAPPEALLKGLDELAAFGLPIEATEFDIDTPDEELQADYMRDHLIAFFSHPATIGVVMWGFWEGRHWKPAAALWRRDWSIKPCGQVWMDLVHKQWWTDVKGTTDTRGTYATRGFQGHYEVTVTHQGRTSRVTASLPREGAAVKVTLGR
ncbi:MAG: endo-1,4-beta-xylanase [Armatimonadota bacterium]|nr:endo-1,4-beta-xylanase [Armatimonadota bacterium]